MKSYKQQFGKKKSYEILWIITIWKKSYEILWLIIWKKKSDEILWKTIWKKNVWNLMNNNLEQNLLKSYE